MGNHSQRHSKLRDKCEEIFCRFKKICEFGLDSIFLAASWSLKQDICKHFASNLLDVTWTSARDSLKALRALSFSILRQSFSSCQTEAIYEALRCSRKEASTCECWSDPFIFSRWGKRNWDFELKVLIRTLRQLRNIQINSDMTFDNLEAEILLKWGVQDVPFLTWGTRMTSNNFGESAPTQRHV